ncbi:MAG: PIN domain-containing protein [Acidiferrobacteraceae bacterium]
MSLVLADTSVWVAHFRNASPVLQSLLAMDQVLVHPLIVLELACGTPPTPRERTLGNLKKLQQAVVATTDEILALIEKQQFYGSGCGAVDMSLLTSVLLSADSLLWTIDKNLDTLATRLGVAFIDPSH